MVGIHIAGHGVIGLADLYKLIRCLILLVAHGGVGAVHAVGTGTSVVVVVTWGLRDLYGDCGGGGDLGL